MCVIAYSKDFLLIVAYININNNSSIRVFFFYSFENTINNRYIRLLLSVGGFSLYTCGVHYHVILSTIDPHTIVLHIFVLFSFSFYIYIYVYCSTMRSTRFFVYICIRRVMKLLTKKGISRNKPSLLSFDKLCNRSLFSLSLSPLLLVHARLIW